MLSGVLPPLLSQDGANVVIADRIEHYETLNQIKDIGGDAIFVKCDVSKNDDIAKVMTETGKVLADPTER